MPLVILGLIVVVGALFLIFSNFSSSRRSGGSGGSGRPSPFERDPNGKIIYLFGSGDKGPRLKDHAEPPPDDKTDA
ncbi:MAG: hypothetical protein LBR00_01415 [Clostridiales Family XIII bacterium]|jgi:hypothetical protein|nr:hypothetical protein [Clostridiales Family XIII bacterium]